jgi:HK97 family phage prohead protease
VQWPWSRKRHTFDSPPKPIDLMFMEMLGRSGISVGRTEALSVPAVQRGRNLVCSIATLPLEQHGPDNTIVASPLLGQLDPDIPNVTHLAQTLEDLLFDSISWWLITAQDFAGFPVAVRHLDVGSVSVQPPLGVNERQSPLPSGVDPRQAVVYVDGKPISASRVIRFDSPNPAVLKVGGRAIRRAILLDKAAGMYADDPRPLDYFTPGEGADPVDDDEVAVLLAQWKAARKERATAYVPAALAYHSVDAPSPSDLQLVELQRQASLDIANALGIDPEDLGISTTSRTYSNDVDRRRNKLNEVLAPYMRAITDRLSMGDVTRRGYTVRFNTAEYLQPNPTERWGVYQTAKGLGVMTDDEIRQAEGMPPLPAGTAEPEFPTAGNSEAVEASRGTSMTFDDGSGLTFADLPLAEFSVDRENRVIEGLALPYGKLATQAGLRIRFNRGSLQFDPDNPGRVKLLRDHDVTQALGKAVQIKDTPAGMLVRFKVARGVAADEALELAEDGVLDGLSVGVDFDMSADTTPDPRNRGAVLVNRADWRETSLTAMPSFDDARVSRVAASLTAGGQVADTETTESAEVSAPETPEPSADRAGAAQTFTADQVRTMIADALKPAAPAEPERQIVDPTRTLTLSRVDEPVPYRFDRRGNFVPEQEHVFSADLHAMALASDVYGTETEAGKRVMALLANEFSADRVRHEFVITTDVDEVNPTIQRPDMFVDQQDFRYPIWAAIDKGAPPNGVNPFFFPKFNSASGLVGDHTEGTEPTGGTYTVTGQTVTPTAVSGKAHITREVWDMGGNPAVSTLIFNQMVRGYREGLESAAATFLNTLTAATDINLGTAATDAAFTAAWEAAVAGLQFVRGYDFSVFVVDQTTYLKAAGARDTTGRAFYPQINPMNANGLAQRRFVAIDMAGVIALPSWALPSTAGVANNSWLFDPMFVHGWSTPPQRLEFPGATQAGAYAPVAFVDLAIWGYKATANSDIAAVRQVIYDSV